MKIEIVLFDIIFQYYYSLLVFIISCIMYFVKFEVHENVCEDYMSETYFSHMMEMMENVDWNILYKEGGLMYTSILKMFVYLVRIT